MPEIERDKTNGTELVTTDSLNARLEQGAVMVSESALSRALVHIVEREAEARHYDAFESALGWRANEPNVVAALSGMGLAKPPN